MANYEGAVASENQGWAGKRKQAEGSQRALRRLKEIENYLEDLGK